MTSLKQLKTKDPLWRDNDFKANKKGQRSTVYSVNGDHYTGEWDSNKKHGKGTQFWKKSGCVYDGDWLDGQRNGFGTYSIPNERGGFKKLYAGNWMNDKKHGHGTYYYTIDSYYEGVWDSDVRYGWGRMYYKDGSVYEGRWLNDKRNGIGMLRFKNENRYEGAWKDDTKHGDGNYFYLDKGQVLLGTWVNDVSKCGEMKDLKLGESSDNGATAQFLIPELELLDSNQVLERAREWFKAISS